MGRHLTLKERTEIMKGLNLGMNISSIATELEYNKSTIAREIKKRRKFVSYDKPESCGAKNTCVHRNKCMISQKCKSKTCFKAVKNCRRCFDCSINCDDFKEEICTKYDDFHMCVMDVVLTVNAL